VQAAKFTHGGKRLGAGRRPRPKWRRCAECRREFLAPNSSVTSCSPACIRKRVERTAARSRAAVASAVSLSLEDIETVSRWSSASGHHPRPHERRVVSCATGDDAEVRLDAGKAGRFSDLDQTAGGFGRFSPTRIGIYSCRILPKGRC
jgi:hypothetical protein